jgi:hypothetical protein
MGVLEKVMNREIAIIRSSAACLFALISAVFVQSYSLLQANLLQYGHNMDMKHIPLPTDFYYRLNPIGYVLPFLAFIAIFLKVKDGERQEFIREVLFYGIMLASVIWILSCIISWQLPEYYPAAVIK